MLLPTPLLHPYLSVYLCDKIWLLVTGNSSLVRERTTYHNAWIFLHVLRLCKWKLRLKSTLMFLKQSGIIGEKIIHGQFFICNISGILLMLTLKVNIVVELLKFMFINVCLSEEMIWGSHLADMNINDSPMMQVFNPHLSAPNFNGGLKKRK